MHQILRNCRGHRGLAMGKISGEYIEGILGGVRGNFFDFHICPIKGTEALNFSYRTGFWGRRVLAKFQFLKINRVRGACVRIIFSILGGQKRCEAVFGKLGLERYILFTGLLQTGLTFICAGKHFQIFAHFSKIAPKFDPIFSAFLTIFEKILPDNLQAAQIFFCGTL